jgi:hypothetical protein
MTFKRLLGIAIVVCAVATLAGSIGAGAASTPAKRAIDLSTNTGVREYLRSVGISPRGVVIQRGARNYAGPRCPGKRWTCTRSLRVVQIATGHGKNRFRCSATRCVVVQLTKSPLVTNTAKCMRTTGITQSCSITQSSTGNDNRAIIYMDATKVTGLTQNASQTAQIVQTAGTGKNEACVFQRTTVDGSTVARRGMPVSVSLDAHQSISIAQNSQSGGNTVQNASPASSGSCASGALNQEQKVTSRAQGTASITQNLNTANAGPNMVVNIAQNQGAGYLGSATGTNVARFDQANTLAAIASGSVAGPVSQTQSTLNGGIEGTINQFSHDQSTILVNQTEIQCVHAQTVVTTATYPPCPTGGAQPTSLTQVQHGPVRKGDGPSIQGDNPNSTFTINQSSTQDSDGNATQTNTVEADCSTSGNCTVTQQTTVDGDTTTNAQSGQNVDTSINCTGSACTTDTSPTFTESGHQLTALNVDVKEFGAGGMRGGDGTGSIAVSGVTGTVEKAVLYWHGPTNSTDPAVNANVTFNGTPVTGTNIGFASDNNWGFQNSQAYKADVTSLVTGSGTYTLSDFVKATADINGVALIVFHDDGNTSNNRNVYLWSGNDSNVASTFDPGDWDETISGVSYSGSGATMDFVVGDGQTFADGPVVVNGTTVVPAGQIFDGDTGPNYSGNPSGITGSLWDVESFDVTAALATGTHDVHLTSTADEDALSLVVAAVNMPVSPPVILGPAAPAQQSATRQANAALAPATLRVASGGRGSTR